MFAFRAFPPPSPTRAAPPRARGPDARPLSVTLLLALVVALSGCMGGSDDENGGPTSSPEPTASANETALPTTNLTNTTTTTTNTTEPTTAPPLVLEVVLKDVGAGGFAIDPDALSATLGDTVQLAVKAHASNVATHRFTLEGFDVSTGDLGPGDEETLEFTADEAGSFDYWCPIGNHRSLGMEGTLTVSEA